MKLRTLETRVNLSGVVVLVRIDADVTVRNGKVQEGSQGRVARAAVGLEWLRQRGARVVVLAHRGRPDGHRVPSLSLAPVAKRLEQLIGGRVLLCKDVVGDRVMKRVATLEDGDVLLLENVRFVVGEMTNDRTLARAWARLGTVYVNDAFASSHRRHASVHGLAKCLPSYAGLELQREVEALSSLIHQPVLPFLVLLGGSKVHTKSATLESLLKRGATVCVGGALAHAFLVASGVSVGKSLLDPKDVTVAKRLLKKYRSQIVLPEDVRVVRVVRKRAPVRTVSVHDIASQDRIVDVGPSTIARIALELSQAKTIVWNGPFGVCEISDFAVGTQTLIRKLAACKHHATTIVGGGDTVPLVEAMGLESEFTLLSTGGGAMMTFLAGQAMPGIDVLK